MILFRKIIKIKHITDFVVKANKRNADFTSLISPVIIGGSGRSGTTLMRVMLDTHPQICAGPETWLFTTQKVNIAVLAKNYDFSENQVLNLCNKVNSRGEFINIFFTEYTHQCGKSRWAEKTPANIEHIDFIFQTFPNAKFIEMIRDGRDVACSLRTHPKYKIVKGQLVPLNTWHPLEHCINRWIKAIEFGRPYWGHPQYMQVRYEDLIMQTETILNNVCDFIKEPFDPIMLKYHCVQTPSRDITRFPQNPEATTPIKRNAIGRWKKEFSEDDKYIFKKMAGGFLEILGYESNSKW